MQFAPKGTTYSVSDEEVKLQPCDNSNHSTLDNMIAEYQLFHDRWIEGLKKVCDKDIATNPAANGNAEMVAVWGRPSIVFSCTSLCTVKKKNVGLINCFFSLDIIQRNFLSRYDINGLFNHLNSEKFEVINLLRS